MQEGDAGRAVLAAMATASELGLATDEAVVLSNSNRLVARLLPCDVVARVTRAGWFSAERELQVTRLLMEQPGSPVTGLDPRVEPRLHEREGFQITMWSYFEPIRPAEVPPDEYVGALDRLHLGLRQVALKAPHFTERLVEIRQWVIDGEFTPDLTAEDRQLLAERMDPGPLSDAAGEQLLHGEPHPGNLLATKDGPLFVDFENCARGPVEYDLAWAPKSVSDAYAGADQDLVARYRGVVLALIAAHRWHREDHHPSGRPGGVAFLNAVRQGPPWRPDAVSW